MPAGLCDFYQLGAKIYVKTTDSRRICKRVQIDLIQLIYSRSRLCLRFFVRCADITQDGGVDTAIETLVSHGWVEANPCVTQSIQLGLVQCRAGSIQ